MKNAIILHGTGCTPNSYWLPYLKRELEARRYDVFLRALPNTDAPTLGEQLPYVLKNCAFDEDTVLIGHSSGVPLALAVLERIEPKSKQAVFVSGFYRPLPGNAASEQMLPEAFDWEVIQKHCDRFVILNSDNDPWGCDDVMGSELAELLDGEFILMKGEGHMGSSAFNQLYKEFPKLVEVIVGADE